MKTPACSRCVAFAVILGDKNGNGTCRRAPPHPLAIPRQDLLTGRTGISVEAFHPIVGPNHWCLAFEEPAA